MPDHRRISGPRADLTGIRQADGLLRLALEGPGIRSIEGVERATGLQTLSLERLESPELGRLEALPALEELAIEQLRGRVDWDALARLARLRYLFIAADDAGQAAASPAWITAA